MLNVTKKAAVLLFIFVLPFILGACHYEQRIDFSELIRRINRQSDAYETVIAEAFYSGNEWFVFSAAGESELLITAKEDEEHILTRVCVTAVNDSAEGLADAFSDYCERVIVAFTKNSDAEKIIRESGVRNKDAFFADGSCFSANGRFCTSLFMSETGCSFVIEIKDAVKHVPQQ